MKQLVVKIFIVTLKFRKTIAMDLQKEITNEIKFGIAIVVIGILGFIIVGLGNATPNWEEWPSTNGMLKSTGVEEGLCQGEDVRYDCWILTAEFEFTTSDGEIVERVFTDSYGSRQAANNAENNLQSMNDFTVYYNPDRPDLNYISELEDGYTHDPNTPFLRLVCGIVPTIVGTGFIIGSLYFAHKNKT